MLNANELSPFSNQAMGFSPEMQRMVQIALTEDLSQGDVTTDLLPVLASLPGEAFLRTRQACVVSGLQVAACVFHNVDPAIGFTAQVQDGMQVAANTLLAAIEGPIASILKAERTALNFMQHLSGIATETARYVQAVEETGVKIVHTRKTTPGLRWLEQQAVLHGGGFAHRFNLGSAVMLKDNHLMALEDAEPNPIAAAIQLIRPKLSHTMKIEVEADRLEQVAHAVEAGADIILLDNMSLDQVREAVALIDHRAIVEVSGGVDLTTIRAYAEAGPDVISTSKITLGVPAIDIGLDLV